MTESKTHYSFEELTAIISRLCAPDGCPWDREQTHETLIPCEELGDVLLQVLMHSEIAARASAFTLQDVIDGISRKMIRRHPHVFGDVKAETPQECLELWKQIKEQEKSLTNQSAASINR